MIKPISYKTAYEIYLGIFAALMFLFPKLIGLGFIGFLPFIFIGLKKKLVHFKLNYILIAWMLLYVLYVFYALFTRHQDLATRYIENKLSFLLIPLVLSFRLKVKLEFKSIFLIFNTALICLLILSFWNSFDLYFSSDSGLNSFFSSSFSYKHHPSYAAVHILLGIFTLYQLWEKKQSKTQKLLLIILALFYLLSYFLCLSLAGILFLMLLVGFLIIRYIYLHYNKLVFYLTIILLPLSFYSLILFVPQLEGEWTSAKFYAENYVKNPKLFVQTRKGEISGSETRLIMWTVSVMVIKDHPMGVGTGNVDEILTKYLENFCLYDFAKKEYNPHNQFFQTIIEIGVFGLFVLVYIIFASLKSGIQKKNWILVLLAFSLFFNSLFESMLQRQSGIVFFTFWICLLSIYSISKKPIEQ